MIQTAAIEPTQATSQSENEAEHVAGMGPIILETGVAFRVWAPNADKVCVVGDFNDWKPNANPLRQEKGGNWFAIVESAKPGEQYKYEITAGDKTFQRMDPRIREVTSSVGSGIIANFASQHYSDYEFGLPAAGKWHRRVSTDHKQWSQDFGGNASGDIDAINDPYDGQSHRGRIELPPYTVLIYSQNAP